MTDRLWRVRITMSRVIEVRGNMTGTEAEEKARDEALIKNPTIVEDDIDKIETAWVNEEVDLEHLDGCYGNHCHHYGCFVGDDDEDAIDYHEYCANCDPE